MGAEDIKHFRPISLLGNLYKHLVKVLANRLEKVTRKVSKTQNAFVEGREILDVSLITNETTDAMHRSRKRDIKCKLDIEEGT